jgi:hypothetical protein
MRDHWGAKQADEHEGEQDDDAFDDDEVARVDYVHEIPRPPGSRQAMVALLVELTSGQVLGPF